MWSSSLYGCYIESNTCHMPNFSSFDTMTILVMTYFIAGFKPEGPFKKSCELHVCNDSKPLNAALKNTI